MITENVLRILNIRQEKVNLEVMIKLRYYMAAVVECRCKIKNTVPVKIFIDSESRNVSSEQEGIRQAIENFLNGNSRIDCQIYNVESESDIHSGINKLIVEFGSEEFKREFEEIFNASNWENAKLKINQK